MDEQSRATQFCLATLQLGFGGEFSPLRGAQGVRTAPRMFTEGESVAKGQKVGKGHVLVINNHATPLAGATATAAAYDADGSVIHTQRWKVEAPASQATDLGRFDAVAKVAKLHFIKLQLRDQAGKLLSDNFYWRGAFNRENDLQALATLPTVKLEAAAKRADAGGKCLLEVTLRNPSGNIALMAHLQLRRQSTGQRVSPVSIRTIMFL